MLQGTENIEAIQLSSSKGEGLLHVDAKSFAGTGLRMLQLRHDVILEGDLQHFPRMLIWLEWRIPRHLESLPDSLHLENIVVLDLSQSAITQVWNQHGSLEAKVNEKSLACPILLRFLILFLLVSGTMHTKMINVVAIFMHDFSLKLDS